jgi:hypothetical protein
MYHRLRSRKLNTLHEQTEGQTGMRSAFAVMLLIQTQPRRSHVYAGLTKKGGNFTPQALPPSHTRLAHFWGWSATFVRNP